ncbi:MFS transporter [Streptomyces albireticuli]|uniref:MFS transporter n=1 Tax=Streptomyces albireticuli TaxID=1940 RepID=A0A2A2D0G8_9ACTN|nr:MFS transporter [Streptomyces albireticuli]MCD9143530.1 MFS transporter [Streptomyces albireticuli]MCD9164889.1 MFS transporter [Streptomyces albireticuli]MCD9191647.1 MFS transporter [Streptomyces albireticuli]PAU45005.1 MFS transporter [Streptomyces albireticuli]
MSGTTTAGPRRAAGVPRQRSRYGQWRQPRPSSGRGAGANRWTVLVVLCVSLLLVAVDATVLHVAVPAVTEDLRPGAIQLLWIVDVYPLVCASLLILFGTLGDRVGRRRVLLLGYGLFGVASALAAVAPTPEVLIGARALLGVGGAMIMPATLSILRQVFPDRRERALAVGVWSAVAAVGAACGPLVGGFLLEHFWWGSVFLINIPLMAVSLPVGRWLLPESTGDGDGPWDVLGALMAAFGLFGVVLAVKRLGGGEPPLTLATVVPGAVGAALLVLFVGRQRRRAHPLVDLRMFARPAFGTSVGCIVLAMLALVGLELIAAQYLQLVLGLTPLETGLRLLPLTLAAMAAGLVGSRLLQRLGPRAMVALGFVLTAAAVASLTVMGTQDRPTVLVGGFVLLGFGLETTLFGAYESMLSEAPAESAGGAAAIGETSYQLGAGIGIALLGSVMNATYAPGVAGAPGVPSAESAAASHSLGEAYEVASRLGGPAGEALRVAARDAFVHGLHVTLMISAGLLLLGAVAATRLPKTMDCGGGELQGGADRAADTVPAVPAASPMAVVSPVASEVSVPAERPVPAERSD